MIIALITKGHQGAAQNITNKLGQRQKLRHRT